MHFLTWNTLRTNLWKPAEHSFTNVSPSHSSSFSKAVHFLYPRRHRISVPDGTKNPTPLDYRGLPSFPAPREISPWELRGRLGLDQLGFPESGFPRPCWSPALVPAVISSRGFRWGVSDDIFFFTSPNSGRYCVSNRLQCSCSVNNRTPHVEYFYVLVCISSWYNMDILLKKIPTCRGWRDLKALTKTWFPSLAMQIRSHITSK